MNRRLLLKFLLASVGARIVSPGNLMASSRKKVPPKEMQITPVSDFYVQSVGKSPKIDAGKWKLTVEGLFDNPGILDLNDIRAKPSVERMVSLACIGNAPGGEQIGNAVWKGWPIANFLRETKVKDNAVRLIFKCEDVFSSSTPIDRLIASDSLLVYEMNGKPLTRDHGAPLRLIQPGCYGMKSPKWITSVVATAEEHVGYWENFGWSDKASIQLTTRIDDRLYYRSLRGVAMNGPHAIQRVEISLDDGLSWQEAEIKQTDDPTIWTEWSFDLGNTKGSLTVVCRAVNSEGQSQDPEDSNPYPDGASAPDRQKFKIL